MLNVLLARGRSDEISVDYQGAGPGSSSETGAARCAPRPPDAAVCLVAAPQNSSQPVSLARALILDPQLLFLDEPTAGLDPDSAKQFVKLLRKLRQELALTVVMVTHDVDTLFAVVDRVAVLADQHIIACGPLAEVARLPHPFVRNFFLGHVERCAEEDVKRFRLSLDDTSDEGGVPAVLREESVT